MAQKVKIQKTRGDCACWRELKKSECRSFTKQWNKVHVCKYCWFYNWPSIFFEYVDMPKQELVFWKPIKPKKRQTKYVI